MQFYTHLSVALCVIILLWDNINPGFRYTFSVVFVLCALLPDIDSTKAKIGRHAQPVSNFLEWATGHRGIMHTIYPPIILAVTVLLLTDQLAYAIAISNGYVLHLLLDSLTPKGVGIFAPLLKFKLKGPFRTGGFVDYGILAASVIFGVFWLLF